MMSRWLSHLLLLLYAGIFLHCQPAPVRAGSTGENQGTSQQQSRSSQCKKKLQNVQADSQGELTQLAHAKLLPLDLALGSDWAALYFGLLFPADQPVITPARGPNAGPEQVFANHPNKAPPVRFS